MLIISESHHVRTKSESNYFMTESMVHINLIITLLGLDFNDRIWSEADCQMMTCIRCHANECRCEGPYHIKYWVNLHVLKGYLKNKKITLVFDSNFFVL